MKKCKKTRMYELNILKLTKFETCMMKNRSILYMFTKRNNKNCLNLSVIALLSHNENNIIISKNKSKCNAENVCDRRK